MSDTNGAGEGSLTMDEAMSAFDMPEEENNEIANTAAPETVEQPEAEELPEGNEAAPDDEQPSGEDEDQSEDDPEIDESSTIDAPRSWTKADKELFKTLPRDAQQVIAALDRAREREVRRGQNEVAEKLRSFENEQRATAEARQKYEAALPTLLSNFTSDFQQKYQDIKTWDDVGKMRTEDPLRFMEWQTDREKGAALEREAQSAQARQQDEWQKSFQAWTANEDQKFREIAPEFFDPQTAHKFQQQAVEYLEDTDITRDEIKASYEGRLNFSIRDHRFQSIIRDAMRWRSAKSAVQKAPVKTSAPVQRPGAAKSAPANKNAEAMKRLSRSGSIHDALSVDF